MSEVDQVIERTIAIISRLLAMHDETVFSQDAVKNLWEYFTFLLQSDKHIKIVERLKESPNDDYVKKGACLHLKQRIAGNWEEMNKLDTLVEAVYGSFETTMEIPCGSSDDTCKSSDDDIPCPPKVPKFSKPRDTVQPTPGYTFARESRKPADDIRAHWARAPLGNSGIPHDIFAWRSARPPGDYKSEPASDRGDSTPELAVPPLDVLFEAAASPPGRVVNTGFSVWDDPDHCLDKMIPLAAGKQYLFCLNIGKPWARSLETTRTDIPTPPGDNPVVSVVVFGIPGGIQVTPGADRGELRLIGAGMARVETQPIPESDPGPPSKKLESVLFFPVVMPTAGDSARLRCNIYWKNILLQSRLVSADIAENPPSVPTDHLAIRSDLDYSITEKLNPSLLDQLEPHRLSMLLNANGDGTHSIFIHSSNVSHPITFGGEELQGLIENARRVLRNISWGTDHEWKEGDRYRYKNRKSTPDRDLEQLREDLISLASWGSIFYTDIIYRLNECGIDESVFEEEMAKPGCIQVAMRKLPGYIIPTAMIYDYPLNTTETLDIYDLCPEFKRAFLDEKQALEDTACFRGECETRQRMKQYRESGNPQKMTTICPSGFWGFRHHLGMPITLHETESPDDNPAAVPVHAPDIPPHIPVRDTVKMSACVSTEVEFLAEHRKVLETLKTFGPSFQWQYADEEDEIITALKYDLPHVLYFYCHGNITHGMLELWLGTKENPVILNHSTPANYKLKWTDTRPLVFINGCHTAGLEPKQALNLIRPLVTYCDSAGVIGTDITIFEELATRFSEQFFKHFLAGEPVGKAIRQARLTLLKEGNPLGLVYNPFILPSLKLSKVSNGP